MPPPLTSLPCHATTKAQPTLKSQLPNPRTENRSFVVQPRIHPPPSTARIKHYAQPNPSVPLEMPNLLPCKVKPVVISSKAQASSTRKQKERGTKIRWPPPRATLGYSVFNKKFMVCCQARHKSTTWKAESRKQKAKEKRKARRIDKQSKACERWSMLRVPPLKAEIPWNRVDGWMMDSALKMVWFWCDACNFASLSFMLISHTCSWQISSV
jgi:hypothetical protein